MAGLFNSLNVLNTEKSKDIKYFQKEKEWFIELHMYLQICFLSQTLTQKLVMNLDEQ